MLIYKRIKSLTTEWIFEGQITDIECNLAKGEAEYEEIKSTKCFKDYYEFCNRLRKIEKSTVWGGAIVREVRLLMSESFPTPKNDICLANISTTMVIGKDKMKKCSAQWLKDHIQSCPLLSEFRRTFGKG